MRKWIVPLVALCLSVAFASPAFADPDPPQPSSLVSDPGLLALISDDDLFSTMDLATLLAPTSTVAGTPTQHYGPFTSSSPDSGTCGNDWAQDTFDRHFTVRTSATGITVVEQFKRGTFTTIDGPSPGACETNIGGTITSGHVGDMHGYFIISNVGSQTSTSPFCNGVSNDPCDTATFLASHFTCVGPTACQVTTYFFHYSAGDQGLAVHEWKNASCDRGGDDGDIADTYGVKTQGFCN